MMRSALAAQHRAATIPYCFGRGLLVSFPEFMSPLVGRLALAWYFLRAAIFYAGNWDATISLMALKDLPAPPALLALGLIVMFLGGISLVLGYHARYGAILLFGFTIAAT